MRSLSKRTDGMSNQEQLHIYCFLLSEFVLKYSSCSEGCTLGVSHSRGNICSADSSAIPTSGLLLEQCGNVRRVSRSKKIIRMSGPRMGG